MIELLEKKRKICVVTGSRAEYGLLSWLMKDIEVHCNLELQIIVTGMHLSPEFGLTYQRIEEDGFTINHKVEMLLSSDTPVGITKSMGLAMIGFADALAELEPDIVILLGDRFETFAAASASLIARRPIAHIHGGELTEGAFDDALRHSISKMAHLHFVATEEYRERVIQLGEQTDRVFNVGALGVENIKRFSLLPRGEFQQSINFTLGKRNLLVTFHPATLESSTAAQQFSILLSELDKLRDTNFIFTKANADTDGRIINKMIDEYTTINSEKAIGFTSLGQLRYYSALQFVDGVVGNSSSGVIEAPSFQIGTINIGDRQKGRIQADSVIDCSPESVSISDALNFLYSSEFRKRLENLVNPYGSGDSTLMIIKVLEECRLADILKKKFKDFSDGVAT